MFQVIQVSFAVLFDSALRLWRTKGATPATSKTGKTCAVEG
jgi:hypothetical protein